MATVLGRGAAGRCTLAPISPLPIPTHRMLTGHAHWSSMHLSVGETVRDNRQGSVCDPCPPGPLPCPPSTPHPPPPLSQTAAWPSSSRSRASLQGWGSRGAEGGGGDLEKGLTTRGGHLFSRTQMRLSHLLGPEVSCR